jgi:hypothetical protein
MLLTFHPSRSLTALTSWREPRYAAACTMDIASLVRACLIPALISCNIRRTSPCDFFLISGF